MRGRVEQATPRAENRDLGTRCRSSTKQCPHVSGCNSDRGVFGGEKRGEKEIRAQISPTPASSFSPRANALNCGQKTYKRGCERLAVRRRCERTDLLVLTAPATPEPRRPVRRSANVVFHGRRAVSEAAAAPRDSRRARRSIFSGFPAIATLSRPFLPLRPRDPNGSSSIALTKAFGGGFFGGGSRSLTVPVFTVIFFDVGFALCHGRLRSLAADAQLPL
jgi:hypothetical protein